MSLISAQNLTFGYEGSSDLVFDNVSFQVDTDWKLGLVGRNGRGKTTLLRLLTGELTGSGELRVPMACTYFPYPVQSEEKRTDELLEELCPQAEEWEIHRELNLLRLSDSIYEMPFDQLSSGERTKVLLAALFLRDNHFLLIDEPTNHLDEETRAIVSRYLSGKKGFLLVSHDRAFLDGCVDHILAIQRRSIAVYACNFSQYLAQKARQDAWEAGENERLEKEVGRLEEAARRTTQWSDRVERSKETKVAGLKPDKGYIGHKAAKMARRSLAAQRRIDRAIEEKSSLLQEVDRVETLKLSILPPPSPVLLRGEKLTLIRGDRTLFSELSFTVEPGERLAITGRNGTGKSSLLHLITGELEPSAGMLSRASGLVISQVEQETDFLYGKLDDFTDKFMLDATRFRTILRKLGFARELFDYRLESLSGGQKKKILLARSLCRPAHLLLWDEPLNYLDIDSRLQLEELIRTAQPTMIFVEHDRAFCEAVATRSICLGR